MMANKKSLVATTTMVVVVVVVALCAGHFFQKPSIFTTSFQYYMENAQARERERSLRVRWTLFFPKVGGVQRH